MESISISILIAIIGVVLSIVTFVAGRQTAAKNQGRQDGQILAELGYLKSNTDEIKKRLDEEDHRHIETVQKLAEMDSSLKSAHKRLDGLERRYCA